MISSTANRIIYNGNGSTTAFSYNFKILASTDIKLMRVAADGTKTNVTSDYYVDTVASIVYYPGYAPGATEPEAGQPSKVQTGEKLVVYRQVPINQLSDMPDNWPFDVNEDMHDKSCIIDQQLQDGINRALKFDVDLVGTFNTTLPMKAGCGWRVNSAGTGIDVLENPQDVYNQTVAVYNNTVTTYNNAVTDTNNIKTQTQTIYNNAVADTTSIKNAAEAIKNETTDIKNNAVSQTTAIYQQTITDANTIKNATQTISNNAQQYALLSQAWAESSSSPSGTIGDKSSKEWALVASSNASNAALSANYCKALAAEGAAYDNATTYEPGDATMTPEGNLWRCITESTGENPSTSAKWVLVSVVNSNTFEPDENGDLMPLMYPKQSSQFDIDENGDIEPAL